MPSRPCPNYIPLAYGTKPKTAILKHNSHSDCVMISEMELSKIKEKLPNGIAKQPNKNTPMPNTCSDYVMQTEKGFRKI